MEQETQEYNLNNVYNEYFNLNESNVYDQYNEHNEYEQYRHRYAEFPWWDEFILKKFSSLIDHNNLWLFG